MTRRHGCMRGEDAAFAHAGGSFGKGHALARDYLLRQLERKKRRVTFVQMEDSRFESELLQQPNAANPEHHLLH